MWCHNQIPWSLASTLSTNRMLPTSTCIQLPKDRHSAPALYSQEKSSSSSSLYLEITPERRRRAAEAHHRGWNTVVQPSKLSRKQSVVACEEARPLLGPEVAGRGDTEGGEFTAEPSRDVASSSMKHQGRRVSTRRLLCVKHPSSVSGSPQARRFSSATLILLFFSFF